MPDLVKKWREQHPYLSALEDEINADYNSQKYQYEKQNEQYEQQRKEYEQWVEANQYGPYGDERDQAGTGPYSLTPDMEYRRQTAAGAPNKLTPYQVAMQATMAVLPTAPETRSNAQLRNEARSLDAASRVAKLESNRQGLLLSQDPTKIYNQQFTTGLRDLGNTANKLSSQAATAKEYASTIEAQRAATEAWQNYAHFRDNPDFVANSKPDPKVENRVYYSMAHPEEAIEENGAAVNAAAYADEDDKAMYFYLWNTYGHQAADKFYDDYVLNKASAAKAADVQRKAMIEGYDKPFVSSVKSIGTNVISGVGLVDMFFQNIARDFGITNPNRALNYNSLAQMPSLVTDSIREGVMKNLNGQKVDDETVDAAAWTAAWLYQNFMSAADSGVGVVLTALGVPSAATLAIMAGAAGTRAIQDARKRGATDSEALRFGMLSAAAEAAFEKISLDVAVDSLLGSMGKDGVYSIGQAILKALGKDSSRNAGTILAQWALNSLTNSFVEGSEELLTTIANDFSDRLIMGDRSEFEQKRQELLAMGVSDKEAARAALKSTINEALQDAAAGAFSGFLMGGGTTFAGQALRPIASTISDRMQLARNLTDYQRGAQQLRQMESELRQVTRDQNPPAAPAVQQRQLTEREQNPLRFAINKAQNGETVTGNDAKAILNDPQAMQTLRDAGVLTENIRPGAEGRAQIQQAVQALAEQNRAETPETQRVTERTSQLPVQNQQETAQERTTPPLPRQMAQEQQERVTTPPVPQNTQESAQEPTLRIRENEVAEPTRQAPLTIRGANATVEENRQEESYGQGQQTETAAAAGEDDFRARAETAAEGARRSYLDRIERSSGLGRVLQDLRNYRVVRGAESRASEVSRIRNQAEAGNQRDVSAQDYGIADGSEEQSAKELDNATASRVLGRNWDRAVSELARQGVTLKAMTGQLMKEDGTQVRAFFSGDGKTIVVQADHPKLSWNQLLDHEDLHRRIKADKNYRKAVEDALLADKKLQAYLPEIIDRYAQAYSRLAPGLSSDDVIEELLADYRAGFDMLDPLGTLAGVRKATKAASRDIRALERKGVVPTENNAEEQSRGSASTEIEVPYNRTALLTEETVDRWLKDYASASSPKYAQAYIARMSPNQFLKLTTSRTGRLTISSQTGPMDAEQLIKSTQEQPLQLIIRDGEVVGHEGRHRVTALDRANVRSIPVLVFDSSNKNSKTDVPEMVLQGQDFGSSRSYDRVTLENMIPLSYENRDKIVREYGKQDAFERSAEKIGLRQTMKFSREIRPEVVDRLDKQLRDGDYVIVYHSMYQDKDGNLYSPMAGKKKVGNKWVMTDPYDLNAWYKSDIPENIADLIENGSVKLKDNGKWSFTLKKPDAKTGDVPAALNPWNHASTDALNDQFTSAYERENDEGELVTVECVIPLSEVDPSVAVDPVTGKVETKPYEEKGMVTDREVVAKPDSQNRRLKLPTTIPVGTTIEAKDSVGLKMWKAGPVHGQISGKRPVYLSRWIRNTRVLSTEETAKMIAKTLKDEGFNGTIPGNVVGLKLRQALEEEGVKFGKPQSSVSKGYYSYMADKGYTRAQAEGAKINSGKFSLNMPVEETADLIALHNLNAEKLEKALNLGGFPMPSIAVTKTSIPHTNFGDITLVMNKDTIDPQKNRKNTVYSADAWTPTFPGVEYEADEKAASRLRSKYYELYRKYGEEATRPLYPWGNYAADELNRKGGLANVIKQAQDDADLMKLYLMENGMDVPAAVTEESVSRLDDDTIALYDRLANAVGKEAFEELRPQNGENPIETRKRWWAAHRDAFEQEYKKYILELGFTEEEANNVLENESTASQTKKAIEIRNYLKNGPEKRTTSTNVSKTNDAIRAAVDQEKYAAWVNDLFAGLEKGSGIYNGKDRYTPSGNERSFSATHYPVTLENIAKAMAAQNDGNTKNVSGFHGVKTLRAGMAKRFSSIQEMHEYEGRLKHLSEEEADSITEALADRLANVMQTIYDAKEHNKYDNSFIEMDTIGEILMEATDQKDITADSIRELFGKYRYDIDMQTAENVRELLFDVSEMPVNIFEAKPERAVRFNEVLAAVVPSGTNAELVNSLKKAGVERILEYQKDNDEDRLEKVNSIQEAKFSREIDTEYMAAAESGDTETAQRMVDEAAKRAGYTIKAYHGTPNKFNVFLKSKIGSTTDYGWFGRGFYFTTKKDVADVYAGYLNDSNVIEAYLKVQNPFVFSDYPGGENMSAGEIMDAVLGKKYGTRGELTEEDKAQRSEDFTDWLRDNGYDGAEIWSQIMILDSEQAKRTDPVTYDDNGNIIPLSERFNPANNDIRYSVEIDPDVAKQFSMEGIEERQVQSLLRENEELKKKLKDAKAQIKTSDRTQPREEDVRRMARDLLKAYSSKADGNQVNESLRELAHTVMSNDARWTDIRDQAVRLAGKILEKSSVLVGDDAALNREIRNAIRKEKIAYTNNGNIPDYGQWRKDNFGKLKIAKDGLPLETRWEELQDTYGKGYFPDDIKNPADQIVYLSELYDRLQDVYENPYNQNMAEATEFLANDIIDRVISGEMRQAPTTYADRAETRLARETLRGELREQKIMERLEAERERRKEQIAELKEHYKGKEAKGRENRKAKELRTKIINHAKQMTTELLKPTDKKHVPESLRKSVAAVLSAIDLGSGYDMTAGQNGNTLRVGRGTEGAEQTKRTKAFLELKEALMKEADGLVLDPELLGTVEEPGNLTRLITELADVPIANMNTEQLQVVYDALRGIEGAVKSANRMLSQARWGAVSEAADAIRSENSAKIAPLQLAGPAGRVQDLTRLDMLTPEGYFHRLGKSGQAVFKLLRSAQDKFITNMTQATEATRKIVGDADVGALEKETHTLTMGGQEVTMTTAQIMELYCLMQRDQGLQHITTGGVLIEPVRKGIKQETQVEPLHPSMEELLNAVRLLTPDEVKMADALQKYLSEDLAELGNEATLNVYGYKKFGQEAKYWKIRSNKNEIQQSIEKETQTTSVANRGFTKAINPQANTSIKIGSIFDTYSQSVNDMATYAAWLDVGEDVNRIRNYVFRDSEGQRTGTVKGVLDRVIGTGGANYLQRLLADIANGAGMDDAGLTSGFVGAYKAAAIGANIRVIAQQPTAILRAAEMIDPKYLAVGLKNPMKAFERAKEYSPIAQWKDWGYFDINTGRKMKDVLFESSSKLEKVRQASMAMAGKADSFAWGQLWGAIEAETKDKTDLKPGTKEFYQACAERFNDIIDHTQVVDGILQRSQIMRSKNAITRMAVSFMSEPTKQYNQFMSAVYDYRHSGDKKQAKQMLARTTFSMLAAGVLNVMAQALVDGLRDDDREKKYWEKVLQDFLGYNPDDETFGKKLKTFALSNMGEFINPFSYLPYAKDIMSIIQGYNVERMDMEALSDTITDMNRLIKALNGEGKQTVGYSLIKLTEQAAKLLGLSFYNIDRDLSALFTTIANDADMPVLQYYLNRYRYKPTENLSKDLKGILWDARQKNDESYDVLVNRLLKDGYTQEQIDKVVTQKVADESGFTEARKAADAEGNNNGSYDLSEKLEALQNSTLTEEDRDIILADQLKENQYANYTILQGYSDYDTWLSIMLSMPDSSPKQSEIEAVLDKRDDLTTRQKAAYWQVLSGATSTKNNPYSQEVGAEILNAKAENQPDKEPEKVAEMRTTLSGLGLQDSKVDALAPVLGGDGTNTSKWRAVANQNLGMNQQDAVLKSIMTDAMYRNWNLAKAAGCSLDDYVKVRENYLDLDGNGKKKQTEWNATLDQYTFSKNGAEDKRIKGTLWQILTESESTKNNPYDKEAGQKVIDAKKGGGKGTGSNAPARIPTLRLPEAPRAEKPSSGLRIRDTQPSETRQSSGLRLPSYTVAPRQSSGLRIK